MHQKHFFTIFVFTLALIFSAGCGKDSNNNSTNNTTACTKGAKDCECKEGNLCDGGLTCTQNKCVLEGVAAGLKISSPDARACDLLIEEKGATILGASYADGVKGVMKKRSPNVAISMTKTSDAAFEAGSISLNLNGELSGVSLKSTTCFDSAGKKIEGVTASLQ